MASPTRSSEAVTRQEEDRLAAVHPTVESIPGCMKLLDNFLICYALGPQIKALYRQGALSTCDTKLEDFKYCMSIKSVSAEEKRTLWLRRRAEWWASRRMGRSSEDVWDVRSEPLEGFPPLPSSFVEPTEVQA